MGNSLSSISAGIVMSKLEATWIFFTLLFFKRYVDDIIIFIPKDKIQEVLETFNGVTFLLKPIYLHWQ